jgi:PAS domain S-box-containing protein
VASEQTPAHIRLLRQLFDDAPTFVVLTRGPDHVYEYLNPAALASLPPGRSAADYLGHPLREVRPDLDAQGYGAVYDGVFRTGTSFVAQEARVTRSETNGRRTEVVLRFSLTPWRDDAGRVTGVLTNAMDITDQVAAREVQQELIRQSEELRAAAEAERLRLAQLLEVIPVGVVIYDRDGRVTMANEFRVRIVGDVSATADVATSAAHLDPRHDDGTPFALDDLPVMRALRGETVIGTRMHITRRDGVPVIVLTSAAPLRDASGAIHSAVQFFQELDAPEGAAG